MTWRDEAERWYLKFLQEHFDISACDRKQLVKDFLTMIHTRKQYLEEKKIHLNRASYYSNDELKGFIDNDCLKVRE